MENCVYNELSSANEKKRYKFSWRPFLRQFYVSSGIWLTYFLLGLSLGAPTVFIPQIRKEQNNTTAITENMASWISSVTGYAGIPWVFPIFTQFVGRRIPFIIICLTSSASFIVLYASTNNYHLLISAIMQGLILTCHHTVTLIIITEYSSPQYRGFFLAIKSASVYWGIWVANALGTFCHWKSIGLCGIICSMYLLTVLYWPESPIWLASMARYDECAYLHRWLKGVDENSEKELSILIESQIKVNSQNINHGISVCSRLRILMKTMTNREFYMPLILSIILISLYHLSGKLACSMYAIDILKKMTDSESTAYKSMLILDGVTVLNMYFGCLLSKFLKRRVLLLGSSTSGVIFLFLISFYLYLVKYEIINENKLLSIILLTLFSASISCGPMILSTGIYSELIPHRFKTSCMFFMGFFSDTVMATVLKVSPYIFKIAGLHGAFLFYGVSVTICTIILYKYLPETKDKTLQEIDEMFKNPKTEYEIVELMHIKPNNVNK